MTELALQQEIRALRAAFDDFVRTNVTAGEIEALDPDVNRVQGENAELEARPATVERRIEELQTERPRAQRPRFKRSWTRGSLTAAPGARLRRPFWPRLTRPATMPKARSII